MRKLSISAKMVEMAIYVLLFSTPVMAAAEFWFLNMPFSEVVMNRMAQAVLNASALLGQDYVKEAASWLIRRTERVLGRSMDLSNFARSSGSFGEAWRTGVAIFELVLIQGIIYLPVLFVLGAHHDTLVIGMVEIISGCVVLWLYHRGYESYVMPAVRALRHTLRRADRIGRRLTRNPIRTTRAVARGVAKNGRKLLKQ